MLTQQVVQVTKQVAKRRLCEECSGLIIKAEPRTSDDGRAIGAEDGHFVCSLCGLIVEQWHDATPNWFKVKPNEYSYLKSLPWIFGLDSALGGNPLTISQVRNLIIRVFHREPAVFWGDWAGRKKSVDLWEMQ